MTDVYHLELRQFPHVTRVFNLDRTELDGRFLRPWVQGTTIDQDDRRWLPERTRLKVLRGPPVRPDELGMGRGWGTATKESHEVTDAVISEAERGARARPEVETLKEQVLQRVAEPMGFPAVVALAADAHPGWRASEQLAMAEQAVWELLHLNQVTLRADETEIPRDRWEAVVLRFASWAPAPGDAPLLLQRAPENGDGRS